MMVLINDGVLDVGRGLEKEFQTVPHKTIEQHNSA